jgi:proline iminopeptidase
LPRHGCDVDHIARRLTTRHDLPAFRKPAAVPLHRAWQLAQAWPGSQLVVRDSSGHTSTDLDNHVVAATDRFARMAQE